MEERKDLFTKILVKFENVVFAGQVSQFNIDLIQDTQIDFDRLLEGTNTTDQEIDMFIDAFHYRLGNALEIVKEGKDREFLNAIDFDLSKISK